MYGRIYFIFWCSITDLVGDKRETLKKMPSYTWCPNIRIDTLNTRNYNKIYMPSCKKPNIHPHIIILFRVNTSLSACMWNGHCNKFIENHPPWHKSTPESFRSVTKPLHTSLTWDGSTNQGLLVEINNLWVFNIPSVSDIASVITETLQLHGLVALCKRKQLGNVTVWSWRTAINIFDIKENGNIHKYTVWLEQCQEGS